MTSWTNTNKSTAPEWLAFLKHGVDPRLDDLQNFTFNSIVFPDGTILKDVTFNELAATVWSNINKSASPTWTQPNQS